MHRQDFKVEQRVAGLSPAEKRSRMLESLEQPGTELEIQLDHFFGKRLPERKKLEGLAHVAAVCRKISESHRFSQLILCAIIAAACVETVTADLQLWDRWFNVETLKVFSDVILAIFTLEVVLKTGAEGDKPWRYLAKDPWNRFDFTLVLISYAGMAIQSLGSVTFLRLLRLLRIVKLLHEYPALKSVVNSLLRACSDVGYVMLMMLIINFVFAVIAIIFFGDNDPDHFGNMSKAMISIWMVETLDAWEEIMCVAYPRRAPGRGGRADGQWRWGRGCASRARARRAPDDRTHRSRRRERPRATPRDAARRRAMSLRRPAAPPHSRSAPLRRRYINMYGCNKFYYTDLYANDIGRFSCHHPEAFGWFAAIYFLCVIVLGGLVLPTVRPRSCVVSSRNWAVLVCFFVCVWLFGWLSVCRFVCLSVWLSIRLFVCFVCLCSRARPTERRAPYYAHATGLR